jgi:hypothetical protein
MNNERVLKELFAPAHIPGEFRQIVVAGLDDTWGMDLVHMQGKGYQGARKNPKASGDQEGGWSKSTTA